MKLFNRKDKSLRHIIGIRDIVLTTLRNEEGKGFYFRPGALDRVVGLYSQRKFSDTKTEIKFISDMIDRERFPKVSK